VYQRQLARGLAAGPTSAPLAVVKLLNNYRSHPDIIELPSRLFYDDQLRACHRGSPFCLRIYH
jgi:hypothetical protein